MVRTPELCINIELDNGTCVSIVSVEDMSDYCNPTAQVLYTHVCILLTLISCQGALIKCCLIAASIVVVTSDLSLSDQLRSVTGAGLSIKLWSQLPQV